MAVDGVAGGGVKPDVQRFEAPVQDVAIRGGQGREVLDARRERISRAIQGTPPVVVLRSVREPLPA